MAGAKRSLGQQDAAHRLLVRLGHMNRNGFIANEPRVLYTKKLMVIELQNLGWTWDAAKKEWTTNAT